jgi:tetratricopeptide (TPR) repeat protein
MKHALLLAGAATLLMAGSALADPLADAKAGLAALNSGDNPAAVRLLTSALASGRLTLTDRELAYVKRAQAYLAMEEGAKALADSSHALDLDPKDAEASATRDRAEAVLARPKVDAQAAAAATTADATPPAGKSMGEYDAAVQKYEAEKKAAADTYAQELAAHDAAVKTTEARHEAELAAWKANVQACETNAPTCVRTDAAKTVAAAKPAAPTPQKVAATPPKKPAVEVAAAAPAPKKPAPAKPKAAPTPIERPAIY